MVKPVQNRVFEHSEKPMPVGRGQHVTVPWSCETITGLAVVYLPLVSHLTEKAVLHPKHMAKEIPEHTEPTLSPRMDDLLE